MLPACETEVSIVIHSLHKTPILTLPDSLLCPCTGEYNHQFVLPACETEIAFCALVQAANSTHFWAPSHKLIFCNSLMVLFGQGWLRWCAKLHPSHVPQSNFFWEDDIQIPAAINARLCNQPAFFFVEPETIAIELLDRQNCNDLTFDYIFQSERGTL